MAYSDWQLQRLRNALRAYHDYGGRNLNEDFNWNSVAEGIAVELGLKDIPVAAERLRQFVEGNRSKDSAMRKFGSLKPELLEAVVKFVTKARLLLPDELQEHAPETQAAQRLLEYLDQSFDRFRVLPPITFEGTYKTRLLEERVFRDFELTLHRPSSEGMMKVTKTEEVFDKKTMDKIDEWMPELRRERCRKRTLYGGWAIFTPEDNVMVFLKEADTDKNLYQFTLAADTSYAPGMVVERLVLLRHNYPIELENTNRTEEDLLRSILQETEKNIIVYKRVG